MAAKDVGYTVVHGINVADLFLIRDDVLYGPDRNLKVQVHPQSTIESWITNKPLHPDPPDRSRYSIFIDYESYARKGKSLKDAKERAMKELKDKTHLIQ